jgi:hypothetical protein
MAYQLTSVSWSRVVGHHALFLIKTSLRRMKSCPLIHNPLRRHQNGYNTWGRGWNCGTYVLRIMQNLIEAGMVRTTLTPQVLEGEVLGAKLEHLMASDAIPVIDLSRWVICCKVRVALLYMQQYLTCNPMCFSIVTAVSINRVSLSILDYNLAMQSSPTGSLSERVDKANQI